MLYLDKVLTDISLDESTSKIIHNVLDSWFRGWTIITIAHQLESIVQFDRVAVMDSGKLVEFDEPKRLLGRDSKEPGVPLRRADLWPEAGRPKVNRAPASRASGLC